MKPPPKHILVYRLSALGDVAMMLPAVYSCARIWPSHVFHIVTSSFCAQLFLNPPTNIVLHPIERPIKLWQLLRMLNHLPIDAVADMHNVSRSWLIDVFFLLKGKRVVMLNKKRNKRKLILKHQSKAVPYTQRYFIVFNRLGLPCVSQFKSVFSSLPPLPNGWNKDGQRWIGIAPFARYINKVYPMELMQQVVSNLSSQSNTRVLLFGGRGNEATTLQQWASRYDNVDSVAGRYSIAEELSLMAHTDTMVTMDSSNMHMASLVGTRVVSVWGSTTPDCGFMGYGQLTSDALFAHLPCQPCTTAGSRHCKLSTMECMKQLSPKTISDRSLNSSAPKLYIVKPTFFMCSYILNNIEKDENIRIITYRKRKIDIKGKAQRFLRAYFPISKGIWNNNILDKEILDFLAEIKDSEAKVLFFGVENIKDLRIMERELGNTSMTVFLWNTVKSRYKGIIQKMDFLSFIGNTHMNVYTFDVHDACMYGISLVRQVYRKPVIRQETIAPNVFFVGKDKGRSQKLSSIVCLLQGTGITLDFHIQRDKSTKELPILAKYYHDDTMPYDETLHRLQKSQCLLEIVQDGQTGVTLRALEALFMNRKLITNNVNIRHCDFYHPDNIMIYDEHTRVDDILHFLSIPIHQIDNSVKNNYDITYWIKQFL